MPKDGKSWKTLSAQYRSKLVANVFSQVGPCIHDPNDAHAMFLHLATRLANEDPDLEPVKESLQQHLRLNEVVQGLSELRAKKLNLNMHMHKYFHQ